MKNINYSDLLLYIEQSEMDMNLKKKFYIILSLLRSCGSLDFVLNLPFKDLVLLTEKDLNELKLIAENIFKFRSKFKNINN